MPIPKQYVEKILSIAEQRTEPISVWLNPNSPVASKTSAESIRKNPWIGTMKNDPDLVLVELKTDIFAFKSAAIRSVRQNMISDDYDSLVDALKMAGFRVVDEKSMKFQNRFIVLGLCVAVLVLIIGWFLEWN